MLGTWNWWLPAWASRLLRIPTPPAAADVDAVVTGVAVAALAADGLLAGLSLDKVIVQLPARRRIGVVAYAGYARSADLGNGVAFYALIGVSAAVLTVAAFGSRRAGAHRDR